MKKKQQKFQSNINLILGNKNFTILQKDLRLFLELLELVKTVVAQQYEQRSYAGTEGSAEETLARLKEVGLIE